MLEALSTNEIEFISAALKEELRLDKRGRREFRPIDIKFFPLPNYGSVELSIGNTRVFSTVSAEATVPYSDRPTEGSITFRCDFASSVAFSSTKSADFLQLNGEDREVLLNRTLDKIFRGSRAIDTEGLCIVASKLVWSIKVDIRILEDDGNLMDAVCAAAITSLLHFRRPDVTVVGDNQVTIHSVQERHPVPLSIHHIPLCVSFAFYGSEVQDYVVDPTFAEESVQLGGLTVCMNSHREICCLSKVGGAALEMDTISHCCDVAFQRVQELVEFIQNTVKQDLISKA